MNEPIRLGRAIDTLQLIQKHACSRGEPLLHLQTFQPGWIGGMPSTGIVSIQAGIDWDAGKVLLQPEKPVTVLTPEDMAAIHDSARKGQSWHAYQAHKKMRDRIRELEAELAALKGRS